MRVNRSVRNTRSSNTPLAHFAEVVEHDVHRQRHAARLRLVDVHQDRPVCERQVTM